MAASHVRIRAFVLVSIALIGPGVSLFLRQTQSTRLEASLAPSTYRLDDPCVDAGTCRVYRVTVRNLRHRTATNVIRTLEIDTVHGTDRLTMRLLIGTGPSIAPGRPYETDELVPWDRSDPPTSLRVACVARPIGPDPPV